MVLQRTVVNFFVVFDIKLPGNPFSPLTVSPGMPGSPWGPISPIIKEYILLEQSFCSIIIKI